MMMLVFQRLRKDLKVLEADASCGGAEVPK